jgi:hypothetical protein
MSIRWSEVSFAVDLGVRLAELDGLVAAVVLRLLLLDDIRLDRHRQMIRLAGQVGGGLIVDAVLLEVLVPQIGPEHGGHAQVVRPLERSGDLLDLPARLGRAVVHGRPHRRSAHVEGLIHRAEQPLIVGVRIAQQLVVVDFDDERNLVRVLPRDRAQHAQRRGYGVAVALDGQLHDVLGIEVDRVRGERGSRRVLDPLIDRQDRQVSRCPPGGRG